MPAIPSHFLNCVVFLYQTPELAKKGNTLNGGTGFVVNYGQAIYVVTNSHCSRHVPTIRFFTPNGPAYITPTQMQWIEHQNGDDLAAYQVDLRSTFGQTDSISIQSALWESAVRGFVEPGTEAFFVGRYVDYSGIDRNTPMIRFGNVAMMPLQPIKREDGGYQDSFLVEARSRLGFSGSPVFAYTMEIKSQMTTNVHFPEIGTFPKIVFRVVWGHLHDWRPVMDATDKRRQVQPGQVVDISSNIACVVPSWKVRELLEQQEFQDMRDQQRCELADTGAPHDFGSGDEPR